MTAADDRLRCNEVITCLHRLEGGERYTRKGLFTRLERWQERFLQRLITVGAVQSTRKGRSRLYQVADSSILGNLIENDEARLDLIFNPRIPRPPGPPDPDAMGRQQPLPLGKWEPWSQELPPPAMGDDLPSTLDAPADDDDADDDVIDPAAYSDRELLESTLKLQVATLQQLDELEGRVVTMEASAAALMDHLKKLIEEFLKMRKLTRKSDFRLPQVSHRVRELVKEYDKQAPQQSERWRAQQENRIWKAISKHAKRGQRRSHFMEALLGQGDTVTQARSTLLRYDSFCADLWHRVDSKHMALSAAAGLARGAVELKRKHPDQYATVEEALAELIAEYDGRPYEITLPDGTRIKRRSPRGRHPNTGGSRRSDKTANQKERPTPSAAPPATKRHSPSRQFYHAIRELFLDYAREQLRDIDDEVAARIYEDFQVDIKLTVEAIHRQISHHRNEQASIKKLADTTIRRKLIEAFETLCLTAPKVNERLPMDQVKRAFRKHAALYHPDKTGDLDLTPRYREVVVAYEFICSVHESQQGENQTHHAT